MLDRLTVERMEKAGEGPILIALSGGGDSVALLHLMASRFATRRLRAAIVDHRLREASAVDARKAAEIASRAGIEAQILPLDWPAGANRAHAAARRLRYAALCRQARALGAAVISAGHTRDDQAETVFLRASRGSGWRGLAGMGAFTPLPIWPEGRGLWLARPLLGARREELRAFLKGQGASWIEDPANEDEVHARVRARRALAALAEAGLDTMRFAAIADRLRARVAALDARARDLIREAASFHDDEIEIDADLWRGPEAVKQRALEALLLSASGAERGPNAMQLKHLAASLGLPSFTGATLGGAWVQRRGAGTFVRRDPGALSGRAGGLVTTAPFPLPQGAETVWDGRVALTMNEAGWSVVCEGAAPWLQRGSVRRPLAAASPHWLLRDRVQHVLGMD